MDGYSMLGQHMTEGNMCLKYVSLIVSPDMLFRRLFIASNPKIYLETLTGI
jgi:hypothetical protein